MPGSGKGAKNYEDALQQVFASGIDVVVDYLWGESAQTVITAIAKSVDDGIPVRFVHVGGASREENIALPGAALRAAAIMLMGSGVGSVCPSALLKAISSVFDAIGPAGLKIATRVVPHSEVEQVWDLAAEDHVWSSPSGSPLFRFFRPATLNTRITHFSTKVPARTDPYLCFFSQSAFFFGPNALATREAIRRG